MVYDIGALQLVFVLTGLHLWAMPILMRRQKEARRNAAIERDDFAFIAQQRSYLRL